MAGATAPDGLTHTLGPEGPGIVVFHEEGLHGHMSDR